MESGYEVLLSKKTKNSELKKQLGLDPDNPEHDKPFFVLRTMTFTTFNKILDEHPMAEWTSEWATVEPLVKVVYMEVLQRWRQLAKDDKLTTEATGSILEALNESFGYSCIWVICSNKYGDIHKKAMKTAAGRDQPSAAQGDAYAAQNQAASEGPGESSKQRYDPVRDL